MITYKNFYIKTDVFISYTKYKRMWLHRGLSSVLERMRTLEPGVTENVRRNQDALLFLDTILFIGFRLKNYISKNMLLRYSHMLKLDGEITPGGNVQ
jgi:hypothetical protein